MNNSIKRIWFSLLSLVVILLQVLEAQASESAITRGPFLQVPSPTSILVRWRSAEPSESCVFYGTNPSSLNLSCGNTSMTTEHQVALSNLQVQTTYFYAVGDQTMSRVGTPDYHFTTAPITGSDKPVRIWFVSDYGYYEDQEIPVRDSMFNFVAGSRPADVWLTGGDNDQHDGSDANDQIAIFESYSNLLCTTPIWPSLGNHDIITPSTPGPCPFYDNFTLPTNGESGGVPSGSELYFSFDYGNVHFISLNSIYPELSASTNTAMLQWLCQDLAATRQRWKIAFWHAPPYTKGSHDSDNPDDISGYMMQMRENALPILESYGVDLVLNGHSHVYERSYFLNGHYGYSWELNATNIMDGGDGREGEDGDGAYQKRGKRGAVYVVAAVGSSPYGAGYEQHPADYIRYEGFAGSCMVDISSNRLDFMFINIETNVLDYFTILKTPAPRITKIEYDGNIELTWDSVPGEIYQVYWQATLSDTPVVISEDLHAAGTSTSWSGAVNDEYTTGFYFVVLAPD
jgi:acid phosphatase type 7